MSKKFLTAHLIELLREGRIRAHNALLGILHRAEKERPDFQTDILFHQIAQDIFESGFIEGATWLAQKQEEEIHGTSERGPEAEI